MKSKILIHVWVICMLLLASRVSAQQQVLTLSEVLDIVRKYHPYAQMANNSIDSAEANLLALRGVFDPSASYYAAQKTFDGKNYYNYTTGELKIPTWYGFDIKAGVENNSGTRLDPEVTAGKSSYVGVSVPVLKNLMLDKRRASIQQAKILVNQTEADRQVAYNNLLFDAAKTYWDWAREYQVYLIIKNTVAVNRGRFELVKKAFLGGDRAAIDTTEALTQLQSFLYLESDAYLQWINTGLELSNYLWLDDEQPYVLPETVIPDTTWKAQSVASYPVPVLEEALQTALQQHPKLRSLDFKTNILEVDRRLKYQNLLPKLNLSYNFLQKGYEPWKGINSNLFQNNYKYGLEVGVPLFLRQARGELKLAKIKLEQNYLQRSQQAIEIQNKVKTYYNELITLRAQIQLYEEAYQNYLQLLRVEEIKFLIGESSLFLVNSREIKAIEALQKLTEIKTKYYKALVAINWATGTL